MDKTNYVKVQESGAVNLIPGDLLNQIGPGGLPITGVVLSGMGITFRWFTDFLTGTESESVEQKADGTTYKLFRDSDGTVYLRSQSGSIAHWVGYTKAEITVVLQEMRQL